MSDIIYVKQNDEKAAAAAMIWLKGLNLNGLDLGLNQTDITNTIKLAHALLKTPPILTLFMESIKNSKYFGPLLQKVNLILDKNPTIGSEIMNSGIGNGNGIIKSFITNGGKGSRMKRKNGKSYTKKKRGGQTMELSHGLFVLILAFIFFTITNKIFPEVNSDKQIDNFNYGANEEFRETRRDRRS